MTYCLDTSALSLELYRDLIKKQNLLPGRRILLQNIDSDFMRLMNSKIQNVLELKKALSSPNKLKALAIKCDLSEEYLTILKREIGSLEQKPVAIDSFPNMDDLYISSLISKGIKSSRDYWESNMPKCNELYSLCDLIRINGVGPTAAKTFYEAGYKSVNEVANATPEEMLKRVSEINEIKQYYRAKLGVRDMQFFIDYANLLDRFSC